MRLSVKDIAPGKEKETMVNPKTRLGIFVFFDPQGIVDGYEVELLKSFRRNLTKLVIVSNCEVCPEGIETLKANCDELYFRENQGLDAAAFQAGMTTFCGWDQVCSYDELVLINDTFFGPIHSFDEMFREMDSRDLDFWGMSAGYRQEDGWGMSKYGYIPDHIQTFFVAFRQNMVKSQEFQDYWNGYDSAGKTSFKEVVAGHEMIMTRHFQDLGFKWDIYADSECYRSDYENENFNIYFFRSYEMMRDMKFPVFKKKVLSSDMAELLFMNDCEEAARAMDYIQNQTDYDENLIWDNVLRVYNVVDLYRSMHLNYVLPSIPAEGAALNQAALVFHVTQPFFAETFAARAQMLSQKLDVYLIPEGEKVQEIVKKTLPWDTQVKLLEPTGQTTPMGAFVLRCRELAEQYAYLGFVHDEANPNHYPMTVAQSTVDGYLQNTARDADYISQVLSCFQKQPRLGVLGTAFPLHHYGFSNYIDAWNGFFPAVKHTAETWKLRCQLSDKKQPIMNTGTFWCRTAALRELWNQSFTAGDFRLDGISLESKQDQVLRRILPYAAQSAGYFSGITMHTEYASMRITDQELMLHELVSTAEKQLGITRGTYIDFRDELRLFGTDAPDGRVTVNLSDMSVLFLAKYILFRYLPRQVRIRIRQLGAALKRRIARK